MFQWWSNDSAPTLGVQSVAATSGFVVTLSDNTGGPGGVGQFATGTFVADSPTEAITFSSGPGGFAVVNAFQLRSVPEPSAPLLLAGGLATILGLRRSGHLWKRRKEAGASFVN